MKRIIFTLFILVGMDGYVVAEVVSDTSQAQLTFSKAIKAKEVIQDNFFRIYPHATISEFYLEKEYGRYTYEVTLIDANGMHHTMVYDAVTGSLLRNDNSY